MCLHLLYQFKYTFLYNGEIIKIQSDKLNIYSFDDDENIIKESGKKVEIETDDTYLLKEYVSELESNVYTTLIQKDNIKNEYYIYELFNCMELLYEDYMKRDYFDGLENRKEAIYKVCYDYIYSNEGYTIGNKKYNQLNSSIKNDIDDCVKKIIFMRDNNQLYKESDFTNFLNYNKKNLKYNILKIGQ